MLMLGTDLVMLFVAVRSFNGYGNNTPWLADFSGTRQLMSFLNAQKYPPSLAFTTMTVGPLLLLLALFERQAGVADPPPGHAGNPQWPPSVTWLISGATVLLLFPACRWFSAYKRRAGHAWLRYV